jgi:glycosyltransferase involved in cell wall biosynthesis
MDQPINECGVVSCVLPTRDRRAFIPQAVWYFLRQDYPRRELIVVDDGIDPCADLIPADPRIRYIRLASRTSLGTKLNIACESARGEYIAHWEDDDWIRADRLSRQIEQLRGGAADACSVRPLHYHLLTGHVWRWADPNRGPREPRCGAAAYTRRAWSSGRFPDHERWKEQPFPVSIEPRRVAFDRADAYYVKLVHADNTGAHSYSSPGWERRPLQEVAGLLTDDQEFYARLRNGPSSHRAAAPGRVTFASPAVIYDGYGSMAQYLALGLARAGVTVDVVPFSLDRAGYSPQFLDLIDHARPVPGAPTLVSTWPREDLSRLPVTPDLFFYTMWESSRLPEGWSDAFTRCRMVFAPTTFVRQVFVESGVRVPVAVVPLGVDPAAYCHEPRPPRSGLHTLMVGTFIPRRNVEIGVEAWKRAFEGDPHARMTIKSRFKPRAWHDADPRISFVDSEEATAGIAHYYRQADALLALGNEGFGLPLVEGMATGLPVVALDSEGQSDVCRDAEGLLLPVKPARWVKTGMPFPECGVRAEPDVAAVVSHLRWIAAHRDEARTMGEAASAWALRHRNIWNAAPLIVGHMEGALVAPRPLRRRHTFLVPSWNTPCGLAEYTKELTRHVDGAHVVASVPDLRGVSTLHIQHEFSLFSDTDMAATLRRAREARVSSVVTMHTVTPEPHAWEQYADTLITLTRRGETMLRQRHPSRRVVRIPLGCPEYFPPRKTARGRIIGAFGFLNRYKGFWQLLDLLRELPDTKLLLFSHARDQSLERQWDIDSAGLPVRRERSYLPHEEIARRLAAEADILVFWYADIAHAATSAAVRLAMATGVPVLASRSAMFDDVGEAVYRPESLRNGVERLFEDSALGDELTARARAFCAENSWRRIGTLHEAILNQR